MIPPLLAYAKQGSATARKLLYVNYGRTEDFDVLKKNYSFPNCEGYIVIIRYGRISRGDKVVVDRASSGAHVICKYCIILRVSDKIFKL